MRSRLAQTFRFALVAVVVLGLAFLSAHQLRGSKTLKLSLRAQALPERVVRWVHVAADAKDVDVAVTASRVLVRSSTNQWRPVFAVDSSLVALEASPRGHFFGVLSYTRRPKPGAPGKLTLHLRDASGAILGSWNLPWDYDRPVPALALARGASAVAVGWADVGIVWVFSPGKSEPARVDLYADDTYGYERCLCFAYDDSLNQFIVLATRHGINPTASSQAERSVGARLFWINPSGQMLKSLALETEGVTTLRFDRSSRILVVGGTDFPAPDRPLPYAEVRSADGRLVTRVEQVTPENFAITSDRRLSVLADPSGAVAVDLLQKLELWRHTPATDNRSILDAVVVDKPACVALLSATVAFRENTFLYIEPKVSLVNRRGKQIGVTAFPDTLLAEARLAPDPRGGLRVLTQDRIWTVSLAQ